MISTSQLGNSAVARFGQLAGGTDLDQLCSSRRLQRDVRGDDRHAGAAGNRARRQREAHAAGGAVTDVADAVDRFPGTAGGDEHAQVPQVRAFERALAGGEQLRRLGQPPNPAFPVRSELSLARLDHRHPALGEQPQVRLRRSVQVHAAVHRRGDQHRAAGGQRGRGHEVVSEPVRELCERIGTRRRDQEHVGAIDERQMTDQRPRGQRLAGIGAASRVGLELADQYRRAGDCLKRRAANELLTGRRLDDPDRGSRKRRQARELKAFVCRDPAGYAEQQPHGFAPG